MRNKFYIFKFITVLVCCFFKIVSASFGATDTTYNRLSKISNDSLRKEKLINYVEKLILTKASYASSLEKEIENEAIRNKDLTFLGNSYSRFGFSYISIGDYINAFPLYIKAEKIYNQIEDPIKKIRVYQDMMWIQLQLKDYEAAKL